MIEIDKLLDFILDIHYNAECYSPKDILLEMLENDLPKSLDVAVKNKLLKDYNICCKEEIEFIHINENKNEYQGLEVTEQLIVGRCNCCGKIYDRI